MTPQDVELWIIWLCAIAVAYYEGKRRGRQQQIAEERRKLDELRAKDWRMWVPQHHSSRCVIRPTQQKDKQE